MGKKQFPILLAEKGESAQLKQLCCAIHSGYPPGMCSKRNVC
ncbi:hypothetical protein [Parageobacillus thermoglucosidasius]|nr:hypothetical protein [Parageobacillus thermoglucosidasius]